MAFRVGQKVVCIVQVPWRPQRDLISVPVRDGVYTIREIRVRGDDMGFCLEEIRNPPTFMTNTREVSEPAFDAAQFRPLVERKTDISIFTAMLNTSKQGQDA